MTPPLPARLAGRRRIRGMGGSRSAARRHGAAAPRRAARLGGSPGAALPNAAGRTGLLRSSGPGPRSGPAKARKHDSQPAGPAGSGPAGPAGPSRPGQAGAAGLGGPTCGNRSWVWRTRTACHGRRGRGLSRKAAEAGPSRPGQAGRVVRAGKKRQRQWPGPARRDVE
jgi:hypothetical protein